MAEARLAVALQFQVTDEGIVLHFDSSAFKFVFRAITKTVKRKLKEFKTAILKRSYPATPVSWMVLVAALSAARYSEHETTLGVLENLGRRIPGRMKRCVIVFAVDSRIAQRMSPSTVIAVVVLAVATVLWLLMGHILQFTLRQLLKYRRFLYEPRGKISLTTKCWWTMVRLFGGRTPLLYSYQNSIPYMPVPNLDSTIAKYLESVEPVMDRDQLSRMKTLAAEFKATIGEKLQRYLVLKSWWSSNWVSDWWEQYVYLSSRAPLLINSNYYGVDSINHPTKLQSARAANMIFALIYYRKQIMKERLEPQFAMGIVPLCSEQFRRTFNTTRIPGKEQDKIEHHRSSSHVAIYHRGRFYKLELYFRGTLLKPADLECQIEKILEDKSEPVQGEELLPALTTANRTTWADTRSKYFGQSVNKASLEAIERAAFFMCLDEKEMDYQGESSENIDIFGKAALTGNGHNVWFDKSFCITIYKNGRVGYNAEHTWADAPIMSHLGEWVTSDDAKYLGYREDGHCKGELQFEVLPQPTRLEWDIPAPVSIHHLMFLSVHDCHPLDCYTIIAFFLTD
ncbi:predicted protein [Nematostella vectensis]|uniref:carnitine O-palmitoyltransferase n=1 Tax=Nematostella vectensis TaxID=45351 RepID=A7T5N0_NEMVE|nr:predicted protein [Nematostella vectensis]|eukprot:XP_001620830.1 hypothetical protein NEMVEDRAFT_v1g236240 [Nematostella vectensis]